MYTPENLNQPCTSQVNLRHLQSAQGSSIRPLSCFHWVTPSMEMPPSKMGEEGVPPNQILRFRPIEPHLESSHHCCQCNIHLAVRQIDAQTASRPFAECHEPLVETCRIRTHPSVYVEDFGMFEYFARLVHEHGRHPIQRPSWDALASYHCSWRRYHPEQRGRNTWCTTQTLLDGGCEDRQALKSFGRRRVLNARPSLVHFIFKSLVQLWLIQHVKETNHQTVRHRITTSKHQGLRFLIQACRIRYRLPLMRLLIQQPMVNNRMRRILQTLRIGHNLVHLLTQDNLQVCQPRRLWGSFNGQPRRQAEEQFAKWREVLQQHEGRV